MKIIDENNMIIDYDIIIMIICLCFQKYDGSIMSVLHKFINTFLELDPMNFQFANLMTKKYINFENNKIFLLHDDTYIIKPSEVSDENLTNENIFVISEIKMNFDLSNKLMELKKFLFSNKRSNITYKQTMSNFSLPDIPITNFSIKKSPMTTGLSVLATSGLVGSLLLFTPPLGGKSNKLRKNKKKSNKLRKNKKKSNKLRKHNKTSNKKHNKKSNKNHNKKSNKLKTQL